MFLMAIFLSASKRKGFKPKEERICSSFLEKGKERKRTNSSAQ